MQEVKAFISIRLFMVLPKFIMNMSSCYFFQGTAPKIDINPQGGKIERAYPDMFEDDDGLLENCSEDVNNDSGGEHGVGDPLESTSALAALSTKPSSENLPKRPPVDGHQWELVWKAENAQDFPLEDILCEFQNYFHDLRPAAEPIMHRRHDCYTSRTTH